MIGHMKESNIEGKQNFPTKSCLILRNIQTPIIIHTHPPTTTQFKYPA